MTAVLALSETLVTSRAKKRCRCIRNFSASAERVMCRMRNIGRATKRRVFIRNFSTWAEFVVCWTRHSQRKTRYSYQKTQLHFEFAIKLLCDNTPAPFQCNLPNCAKHSRPEVGKLWPAGRMRPAKGFHAARRQLPRSTTFRSVVLNLFSVVTHEMFWWISITPF